jgi:hypothetical protein
MYQKKVPKKVDEIKKKKKVLEIHSTRCIMKQGEREKYSGKRDPSDCVLLLQKLQQLEPYIKFLETF